MSILPLAEVTIAASPPRLTPAPGIATILSDGERMPDGDGGMDRLHGGVCRLEAAPVARRQRQAGAGVASRHRHAGPPALLRRAGSAIRRIGAAPSRLRPVGTAGMDAQRARYRRRLPR